MVLEFKTDWTKNISLRFNIVRKRSPKELWKRYGTENENGMIQKRDLRIKKKKSQEQIKSKAGGQRLFVSVDMVAQTG